jgi:hypothetical protein
VTPRAATLAVAVTLVGTVSLAGCGALGPYATLPAAAMPDQPAGGRVAICYNPLRTPEPAVAADAARECPAGSAPERVDTDYYLDTCPLLLPARATFVCVPNG